ncbi:MAG: tRNA glutamyl-Q(34) synthetase GluQRS [Wenzhouxiangellaceae bacterium]|nr:tRNA glutamyl-Q(34) synthetase GluQRS [Wenzhouxiangellaceae bacterium]
MHSAYVGRFAPSPTGPLHFGSLLAAVASFVQARANNGRWLVRIEDIDPPREVPGAARAQLATLRHFGLIPDRPPSLQSRAAGRHRTAIAGLLQHGLAFHCACSRADLEADGRYPGTCRNGLPAGRAARAIRLRVPAAPVEFTDRLFGPQRYALAEQCGDFVIRRADGCIAYQLAVVIDDLAAGVSEVVRGVDLLDSTPRQIAVCRALGRRPPAWLHLPLAVDRHGRKLSKSAADDPVIRLSAPRTLARVLQALGHRPPAGMRSLASLLNWAVAVWNVEQIPREPFEVG